MKRLLLSQARRKYSLLLLILSWGCVDQSTANSSYEKATNLAYSPINPQVIRLDLPAHYEKSGGIVTADINNDAQKELVVTQPGQIAVYTNAGEPLWSKSMEIQLTGKAEDEGLPGLHAPGVQAADVDGDGRTEVLALTPDNHLEILQGSTGETQQRVKLQSPPGTERWEHLVVADFRGEGDRDLLLQATNAEDYRLGRYLAAYAVEELLQNDPQPLWTRDDFHGPAHNGARVADLDGDGRDEVLGGTLISPDGERLFAVPMKRNAKRPHIDSLYAADVRPDIPGLEVVALEEGGDNRIFLYNGDRLIWKTHFKHQEPQNAAIGDFDPDRPGLEIWCRSRYDEHQKPFVFDAQGKLIAHYELDNVAPPDWTDSGVEVIFTIDWTGSGQLAAAKERHESGDVAIFNPINGEFLHRFPTQAERLYVADVLGDWREELVVIDGDELQIYSNQEPNPHPERSRLWTQDHYRHSKMTWNYYSP